MFVPWFGFWLWVWCARVWLWLALVRLWLSFGLVGLACVGFGFGGGVLWYGVAYC